MENKVQKLIPMGWRYGCVVEPCKSEALSSNPSTAKKKKKIYIYTYMYVNIYKVTAHEYSQDLPKIGGHCSILACSIRLLLIPTVTGC
jgi:hypothetical protein